MDENHPFDHVVVLMLENQSFDRVLGWVPGADGSRPEHYNLADPKWVPGKDRVLVHKNARKAAVVGPHYPADRVIQQILHPESGFVSSQLDNFRDSPDDVAWDAVLDVMGQFGPDDLPVTAKLARDYLVCDRWFSPMPASTAPNRFFLFYGTSPTGALHNFAAERPRLLEVLDASPDARKRAADGAAWRLYLDGVTPVEFMAALFPEGADAKGDNIKRFWHKGREGSRFADDVQTGRLAALSIIEPRHFSSPLARANSNHHHQHIHRGERLVAEVYNALARAPATFARTLLVVTHDEHGGFYDHVPTVGAPDPKDGKLGTHPSSGALNWYGPRVPTLLISPRLPGGLFPARKDGAAPPPSEWATDHTFIPALLTERWKLGNISRRVDANAAKVDLPWLEVARDAKQLNVGAMGLALETAMRKEEDESEERFKSRTIPSFLSDLTDDFKTGFIRPHWVDED